MKSILADLKLFGPWLLAFRRSYWSIGFAAAILTLGLGLNVGVFTLIRSLLLRPLPVHNPSELVRFRITGKIPKEFFQGAGALPDLPLSLKMFNAVKQDNPGISKPFAWTEDGSTRVKINDRVTTAKSAFVSGSTFSR